SRCAPTPRPGKFFGQVVTMRQVWLPWEMAGVASATAPAPTPAVPAFFRNERRSMKYLPMRIEQTQAVIGCEAADEPPSDSGGYKYTRVPARPVCSLPRGAAVCRRQAGRSWNGTAEGLDTVCATHRGRPMAQPHVAVST